MAPKIDRFMPLIDRLILRTMKAPTGCIIFTGRTRGGYGTLRANGKAAQASRVAYELFIGPIPEGHDVLHSCGNPPCINPLHLWTGTDQDNMDDRDRKGRQRSPRQCGEANGQSKLTAEIVAEIKKRAAAGEQQKDLAEEFGIGEPQVSEIVHGKYWRHIQ